MESPHSYFFDLPLELRIHIYQFALADSDSITISTATINPPDETSDSDPTPKTSTPGLPSDQIPLVRCGYDASLLAIGASPSVQPPKNLSWYDSGFFEEEEELPPTQVESDNLPYPTSLALLQVCHQIRDEVEFHVFRLIRTSRRATRNRDSSADCATRSSQPHGGLSLYVSYPYGLFVLKHHYPHLVRHARSIHISGYFVSDRPNPYTVAGDVHSALASSRRRQTANASRARSGNAGALARRPLEVTESAQKILEALVRQVLSARPAPLFTLLQMRILYAGSGAYSHVWVDPYSPVCKALHSICGGEVELDVLRGRHGCGLDIKAKPNPEGRILATRWKTLGDSKDDTEGFVVDPNWPNWQKPTERAPSS